MDGVNEFLVRQIWQTTSTAGIQEPHCTAFALPARGLLVINATMTITLADVAVFQPLCTAIQTLEPNATLPFEDFRVPFVASTIPQVFVIGAMLVISWTLVIILIITPRTSFVIGGGGGIIGRRAVMGGAAGTSSVIGVGGRPWLQKVAATTVGISLVIATVNSMRVASEQYSDGYEDAIALTNEVVGSLEIRIVRIVSDTFLWLAQVQTLIRLFPRHKEKVIIKWTGFALITLDTIFSILDNFVATSNAAFVHSERDFTDAVPALAYFFQLTLSLVYAALVMYYSLVKRRFAYYHRKMPNISVVAIISILSISVPIIFFVLDIAEPDLIGWGDYVRWVGGAAASVVVWEWVERMEALEREERKDGILGREIFDGDDMAELINPVERRWLRRRRGRGSGRHGSRDDGGVYGGEGNGGNGVVISRGHRAPDNMNYPPGGHRQPVSSLQLRSYAHDSGGQTASSTGILGNPVPAYPDTTAADMATPISRSDTTSATSTVYAVIHHPTADSPRSTPSESPLPQVTAEDQHSSGNPASDAMAPNRAGTMPNQPGAVEQGHLNGNLQRQPTPFGVPQQLSSTPHRPPTQEPSLVEQSLREHSSGSQLRGGIAISASHHSRFARLFRRSPPAGPSQVTLTNISLPTPAQTSLPAHINSSNEKGAKSFFGLRHQQPTPASELPVIIMRPQPYGQMLNPSTMTGMEGDNGRVTTTSSGGSGELPSANLITATTPAVGALATTPAASLSSTLASGPLSHVHTVNNNNTTTTFPATSDHAASSLAPISMPRAGIALAPTPASGTPASSPSGSGPGSASGTPSPPPQLDVESSEAPQRTTSIPSRTGTRARASLPVVIEGDAGEGEPATPDV